MGSAAVGTVLGSGRGNITRVLVAGTVGGNDFVAAESSRTGYLGRRAHPRRSVGPSSVVGAARIRRCDSRLHMIETPTGQVLSAPGLRTLGPSIVGLVVVAVLVVIAWRRVHRAGSRQLHAGFLVLAVAIAVAAITVIVTPIDVLGLSPHKVRWLWVIGAFITYMLVMALLVGLRDDHRRWVLGAVTGIGVVALLATIPTRCEPGGPGDLPRHL